MAPGWLLLATELQAVPGSQGTGSPPFPVGFATRLVVQRAISGSLGFSSMC